MHAYVKHTGAWMPWDVMYDDEASARLRSWLKENVDGEQLSNRVIITPQKSGNAVDSPAILGRLARNAPWYGSRNPGPPRHGLVVSAWPREPELQLCISRAHDATLVVFQWGNHLRFDGWATAVGAFNAATGEPTPSLDKELDDEFRFMLMYNRELGESAKRGAQRQVPQSSMATFKQAGLSEDFVVTYCIGLGFSGDHRDIRKHYQAVGPLPGRYQAGARGSDLYRDSATGLLNCRLFGRD